MTTVSHSNITTNSQPFTLAGAKINASISGTIADGIDPPELEQLVGGNWMQLDPRMRFMKTEIGSVKTSRLDPAATAFRWRIPFGSHTVSTSVISSS
ncbi:hypothetical protein [Bradyrhizobium sp. STM 3557]|uniref:hypothetical protein n=1 Tax=Bradyrhizobium sp. STM 3557 TaxID=578920 RepID=UPI00388FD72E